MKHALRWIPFSALVALALSSAAAQAADAAALATTTDAGTQASAWQHHQAKFSFMGFTTAYSCDGVEGKVKSILKFFGARNPQADASGCPRGPDSLSHTIWLNVEFDSLRAAPANTPSSDVVQARWTPVRLDGQRPFFMGEGDCELIYAMKSVLTDAFSFQNLSYETSCTPHEVTFNDFRVKGEVLKSPQEHKG
ncbi:MAG TPA: hypothetical protein VGL50_07095 [Steroidobacteraceae bacterium]